MPNLTQLRLAAREIFDETLRAVDPSAALKRAVRLNGSRLIVGDATFEVANRKIYSVAIGKAAFKMASALEQVLANSFSAGLMSGPQPAEVSEKPLSDRWRLYQGGHPLPDEASLMAAGEAFKLLRRANEERALIIFLISGGGSAMLEWPLDQGISLADLRSANQALVGCGASIAEVNAVRRAFSAVKGGRLGERAPDCDQITLIVSDVPPGTERNVASGPTLTPPNNAPQAQAVIDQYGLRARLPESILRSIDNDAEYVQSTATSLRRHFVLLDNQSALQAAAEAARRLGFLTEIAEDISDQPIADGCRQLLSRFKAFHDRVETESAANGVCLISGGEFACPVNGPGLGGRNLETALRLATEQRASLTEHFVGFCAGTDGIDGNSPAAGTIIDSTTIDRAQTIGLDPSTFIEGSDAYSFFVALGDVVATGATGTNVRDVRILLASNT
jgi:hydroxypyruvate reductase